MAVHRFPPTLPHCSSHSTGVPAASSEQHHLRRQRLVEDSGNDLGLERGQVKAGVETTDVSQEDTNYLALVPILVILHPVMPKVTQAQTPVNRFVIFSTFPPAYPPTAMPGSQDGCHQANALRSAN
jgi:hypothetical protein